MFRLLSVQAFNRFQSLYLWHTNKSNRFVAFNWVFSIVHNSHSLQRDDYTLAFSFTNKKELLGWLSCLPSHWLYIIFLITMKLLFMIVCRSVIIIIRAICVNIPAIIYWCTLYILLFLIIYNRKIFTFLHKNSQHRKIVKFRNGK